MARCVIQAAIDLCRASIEEKLADARCRTGDDLAAPDDREPVRLQPQRFQRILRLEDDEVCVAADFQAIAFAGPSSLPS